MIFNDILVSKAKILETEFDKLFELVLKNQNHYGDLLLVHENGFYNPDILKFNNSERKYSPYTIGPSHEGHSESLHYKFIHSYRTQGKVKIKYDEYIEKLKWNPERREEIEELQEIEGTSIQLEMLVYLKIWESDAFIKKFYQLARLLHSEKYDWHFKIAERKGEKGCTGVRHEIIRTKIRDRFETLLPNIYNAFKNAYRSQIRNSIAHSNYSFLSRHIHPNNYKEGDPSSTIQSLGFDEWIQMFHDTMIIYNEYIRFFNDVNQYYAKIAQENKGLIEIQINRSFPTVKTEYLDMKYRPKWNDFVVNIVD